MFVLKPQVPSFHRCRLPLIKGEQKKWIPGKLEIGGDFLGKRRRRRSDCSLHVATRSRNGTHVASNDEIPGSSVVEQVAVNHLAVGSNPTPGAISDQERLNRSFFAYPC